MKVIFAHDHIFYKNENRFFSNGSFPKKVLERYTNVFGELTVVSRQKNIDLGSSENYSLASAENINFIEIPNFRNLKKLHLRMKAAKKIEKEVIQASYVIARVPSSIGQLAVKFAQKHNKPYLVEVVGCAWDSHLNYGSWTGKIFAPLAYMQQKSVIKDSPYTIYITENFLQSRYPSNGLSEICPNVNIEEVNNNILINRINNINLNKKKLVFGLVGSLDVNYKGHETTIKALGVLKAKFNFTSFDMEFVGKGDNKKWVELASKHGVIDHISFKGTIPNEKISEWYDQIDISIQPSNAEAQGRSIIEAMSRGCTVIASNVGGIPELINEENLIDPNDFEKLATILYKFIDDRERLINNAKINFKKSKMFERKNIERKRENFLKGFENKK